MQPFPRYIVRYIVQLTITIIVYVIAVLVSTLLLNLSLPRLLRILIALMPMIPACFIPIVVVRLLKSVDERIRVLHLEAFSFAFAGTALLTFAYGFLQLVGFPHVRWFFVWPLMAILWGIGVVWASWRYFRQYRR